MILSTQYEADTGTGLAGLRKERISNADLIRGKVHPPFRFKGTPEVQVTPEPGRGSTKLRYPAKSTEEIKKTEGVNIFTAAKTTVPTALCLSKAFRIQPHILNVKQLAICCEKSTAEAYTVIFMNLEATSLTCNQNCPERHQTSGNTSSSSTLSTLRQKPDERGILNRALKASKSGLCQTHRVSEFGQASPENSLPSSHTK